VVIRQQQLLQMALAVGLLGILLQANLSGAETSPADIEHERQVRELVYKHELAMNVITCKRTGLRHRTLNIPGSLHDLYEKNPQLTMGVLLRIIRGGSPSDSRVAVAFALGADGSPISLWSLLESCDDYDYLEEATGVTKRESWARLVERLREEAHSGNNLPKKNTKSPAK
jgi:hypothetical protein